MSTASVTLVVVPRERFSHVQGSLESIYQNSDHPFDLVYVDGKSPSHVRDYLQLASAAHNFRLIRTEKFLSPNEARNLGARDIATKYVVFLDNDVHVAPKWLSALVECAEETGAWAVAPLYFEGAPKDKIIHMAGGKAGITETNGIRTFHEEHVLYGARYVDVREDLRRAETDCFEFHAVLMPVEILKALGPLDEQYLSSHEHLDMSLLIRQAGGKIYLAPESHVTYVTGLLDRSDYDYGLLRWSDEWTRQSTDHFIEKWNLNGSSEWADSVMNWSRTHRRRLLNSERTLKNVIKREAGRNVLTRRLYAILRDRR